MRPVAEGASWSARYLVECEVGIVLRGPRVMGFICDAFDAVVAFEPEQEVCVRGREAPLGSVEVAGLFGGDLIERDLRRVSSMLGRTAVGSRVSWKILLLCQRGRPLAATGCTAGSACDDVGLSPPAVLGCAAGRSRLGRASGA